MHISRAVTRRQLLQTCGGLWIALGIPISFAQTSTRQGSTAAESGPQWPEPGLREDETEGETSEGEFQDEGRGCALSAVEEQQLQAGGLEVLYTCGIPQMDNLMRAEAQLLGRVMGISPGFYFFDDRGNGNAYATPVSLTKDTDGTVLYGVELFHTEANKYPLSGNALIGILAHEFGHILEFSEGLRAPGPQMELLSDFMAGWYLGLKAAHGVPGLDIRPLAASLFNKGTYDFNNPSFHGTPEQRVGAMIDGYQPAFKGARTSARAFDIGRRTLKL